MSAANWVVGLMLLSTMAVKLLWGFDLVLVAHLTPRQPRWRILRDGSLYLGWFFVLSGVFVYGAIGYVLLRNPGETVPLWFAVPCAMFTVDCVLAWHFLKGDHWTGHDT